MATWEEINQLGSFQTTPFTPEPTKGVDYTQPAGGPKTTIRKPKAKPVNLAPPKTEETEMSGISEGMTAVDQGYIDAWKPASTAYTEGSKTALSNYYDDTKTREGTYQTSLQGLMSEAAESGKNAQNVYTNTVEPNLKNIMGDAQKEAAGAMTLAQASDPNNPVAAGFRDFYEGQAQGTRNAGLADVGVMQSMGAQAMSGQIGGGMPLTGGQLQAMSGANQSQAGQAFSNVQRNVQNLRNQGIQEGWDQTDKAYDRGQGAKDRYTQSVGDYSGANETFQDRMSNLRGERGDYTGGIRGSQEMIDATRMGTDLGSLGLDAQHDLGLAGLTKDMGMNSLTRGGQIISNKYGKDFATEMADKQGDFAERIARIQAESGEKGAKTDMYGNIISSIIQGAGSYFGGS